MIKPEDLPDGWSWALVADSAVPRYVSRSEFSLSSAPNARKYSWRGWGSEIICLLAPVTEDEWVEVDRQTYWRISFPGRRRITFTDSSGNAEIFEVHRDDLPKPEPVDERVEVVMEVLGETEQIHHAEVTRQILAALDAMGGATE